MSYNIDELFDVLLRENGSDMHLRVGLPPSFRIEGSMVSIDGDPFNEENMVALVRSITHEDYKKVLDQKGSIDFVHFIPSGERFRINAFRVRAQYGIVIKHLPKDILTFDRIGIPEKITETLIRPQGLVLITGLSNSGKSTTLSTMIDWINTQRAGHILTLENPVEYFHKQKKSIVTQREVGVDCPDFKSGIRDATRQDANVIVVGEMRDFETIEAALTAAETGNLVFGTMNTPGAVRTIDRIINVYPNNMKDQVRNQLAGSLLLIISQYLLKHTGGGRIASFEMMYNTSSVEALIRENKTFRIDTEIQTGAKFGMISSDMHMLSLYKRRLVEAEEIIEKSTNPDLMRKNIENEES